MKRGFTLIELLVVIAIIGVLSSVVLVSLNASRAKARDAQRVSNMREIQKALEGYANDHSGSYPSTSGSLRSQCSSDGAWSPQNIAPGLVPTYISQYPADPEMKASSNTCCLKYSSNGTEYVVIDFNCPTAGVSNSALAPLIDPKYPTAWSIRTPNAVNVVY